MIIVEGPDGSGKSTLVETLEKKLGVTREPRAVTSSAELLRPIGHYVSEEVGRGFGLRLYDRFALISSPFYCMLPNPTLRDEMLDREWLFDAWMKFKRVSPIIVVCLPPLETVRQNVLNDSSSKVMWEHINTIYWLYHNFTAQYPWVTAVWDYTQNDISELNFVIRHVQDRLHHLKHQEGKK